MITYTTCSIIYYNICILEIYTRKEQFQIEIKTSHFRHIVSIIVSCCCNKTCKKKKKSASQVNDEDKLLENPQGLKHCHTPH